MDREAFINGLSKDWTSLFKLDSWDDTLCVFFLTNVLDTTIGSVTEKDVKAARTLLTGWKRAIDEGKSMTYDNLPSAVVESLRKEGFTELPDVFRHGYTNALVSNCMLDFRKNTGRILHLDKCSGDFFSSMVMNPDYLGNEFLIHRSMYGPLESRLQIERPIVYVTSYTIKDKRGRGLDFESPLFLDGPYTRLVRNNLRNVITDNEVRELNSILRHSGQLITVLDKSDIDNIVKGHDVKLPCGDVLHVDLKEGKREFSVEENKNLVFTQMVNTTPGSGLFTGMLSRVRNVFINHRGKEQHGEPIKEQSLVKHAAPINISSNGKNGWGEIYDYPFSTFTENKIAAEKALGITIPHMNDSIDNAISELFREWHDIVDDAENVRHLKLGEEDLFWIGQRFTSYSDKVFDETLKERFISSMQRFELTTGLHPNKDLAVERKPGTLSRADMALEKALQDYSSVSDASQIMNRDKIERIAHYRISKEGRDFLNKTTFVKKDTVKRLLSGKMYRQLKDVLKVNNIPLDKLTVKDIISLKEGKLVVLESGHSISRVKEVNGYGVRISQLPKQTINEVQREM